MDTFKRISAQKAHEIIGSQDVTIVDIRDTNSFTRGHIPQAQNISDENMKAFIEETNKETPLICYCYHGNSSRQAAAFFVNQGFKQVYSIDGGWEGWEAIYV